MKYLNSTCSPRIKGLIGEIRGKWGDRRNIAYWCQDEARLGFRTEPGQKITLKGVKPQQTLQWHYDFYYIYGWVEPFGGRSLFDEFSYFNSSLLGLYLEELAPKHQDEIHIIQLDNAPCHTANKLVVPENVIWLFQLTYCPELNPVERVWQYLKRQIKTLRFNGLEDLRNQVADCLNNLSKDIITSFTGWQHILDALSL
ncbi:MAG: hypothetical protein BRC53_03555 [Cyanobacteria bacterium SW_6_48_11]|nr:MAG: hypothetical protein BRC53_03555 [Cyanobacteria bacterium SW_6_48_11]